MQTATATQTTTRQKPSQAEPTMAFNLGEWRAFQNGMLCSLMGYTQKKLAAARTQWSRPHRWAWDAGYNGIETLTSRADVQWALAMRLGGEE